MQPQPQTTAVELPPQAATAREVAGPSPEFERLLSQEHVIGVFEDPKQFEHAQRIANMLVSSKLAPEHFRGEENVGSAVIAVDMAFRLGMNPLMVMQQLYVVHGKPGWSAQFVIAVINASKRFSPLRYRYVNNGKKDITYNYTVYKGDTKVKTQGTEENIEDWECIAYATDLASGEVLESTPVSMELAIKEGWFQKSDSKWQTMPRQMMTYRAAAFWGRIYAPELMMGLQTAEEIRDVEGSEGPAASMAVSSAPAGGSAPDMKAALAAATAATTAATAAATTSTPTPPATTTEPKASEPPKEAVKKEKKEKVKDEKKTEPPTPPVETKAAEPTNVTKLPSENQAADGSVTAKDPDAGIPSDPTPTTAQTGTTVAAPDPDADGRALPDEILEFLATHKRSQEQFKGWLAATGRCPDAQKLQVNQIPEATLLKLLDEPGFRALNKFLALNNAVA